jgi:ribosomal-protein-alanine N-acetyltransferase
MTAAFVGALLSDRRPDAAALIGAELPDEWPDAHDERFLRLRLRQMERDPQLEQWLVRALVLRRSKKMIGHAGFHGAPGVNGPRRLDALEIGYTVFPSFRRRGYATEAAAALMDWARDERGIRHFVASVAPSNDPSLAVVRKLGFVQTGEQWDSEDGLELVFEL